jgi:hypothetical protein
MMTMQTPVNFKEDENGSKSNGQILCGQQQC